MRLVVVVFTVVTISLVAAVGVSAGSGIAGTYSSPNVAAFLGGHIDVGFLHNLGIPTANEGKDGGHDKEKGHCHEDRHHHKHATPGHDHDPCGDDGGSG